MSTAPTPIRNPERINRPVRPRSATMSSGRCIAGYGILPRRLAGRGWAMPEQDRAGVGAAGGTLITVVACHRNTLFIDALTELVQPEGIEIRAVSTVEDLLASTCADACLIDVKVEGAL